MSATWVNLSTRWSLPSVQAALNVIISVLSIIGIWAFSRYWWQRGCKRVIHGESDLPLSSVLTLSTPGEGWDAITVLRKQLFSKGNWHVLIQLIVVVGTTLACMFAGPIAKVSIRNTHTIQRQNLEILPAVKGDGGTTNLLEANVLWNDTIWSLNEAAFPYTQLLDYLPPTNALWTYEVSEWEPTWTSQCGFQDETQLYNVTGVGNYTFYDPINAFPVFRDTYDPAWLNRSKYRIQADFTSWIVSAVKDNPPFQDVLFFVLIEPDPELKGRMNHNNDTMQLSLSVLHAQNFHVSNYEDVTEGAATAWKPIGPVENASYTRVECNITRKAQVVNEHLVPWIWTNDTYAITMAYWTYWSYLLESNASKNLPVPTPTPQQIWRFFQAYMISVNTVYAENVLREVSVWVPMVQLSTIFLALFLGVSCLTLWLSGRYVWFLRQHKSKLREISIPDCRMDWMIHAAKIAGEEELIDGRSVKDRDYFRTATFGYRKSSEKDDLEGTMPYPKLARVYSSRTSLSGSLPKSRSRSRRSPVSLRDADAAHEPDLSRKPSFGIRFLGDKWSEENLIGMAYAYEQRTKVRDQVQPYLVPKTELADAIKA